MAPPADGDRRALARALVAEFAPEELLDFDLMTEAYFASPGAARRARQPRDEPGGLTFDPGDPTFTNLIWGVIGGLTTEALLLSLKNGRSRLRTLFGRGTKPGPDTPLPDLPTGSEASALRELIIKELDRAGYAQAENVADRTIERWKRRDWTPPG